MSVPHTVAAVSGFGLRVIPRAPFVVVRGPNANELDVQHQSPRGPRFVRVIPNGPGRYRTMIDQQTKSPAEVLDVAAGPVAGDWQLDTTAFRTAFPPRFALHSAPADSPSPFDLLGPGSSQIYVQAPRRMPPASEMCGPGQRITKQGPDWVELAYEHQARKWWQRHQIAGPLVFSVQAPAEARDAALGGLDAMLQSLVVL